MMSMSNRTIEQLFTKVKATLLAEYGWDVNHLTLVVQDGCVTSSHIIDTSLDPLDCAGSWTPDGVIYISTESRLREIYDRDKVQMSYEDFKVYIMGHECAHEVITNILSLADRMNWLQEIQAEGFTTAYAHNTTPEEIFCEYIGVRMVDKLDPTILPEEDISNIQEPTYILRTDNSYAHLVEVLLAHPEALRYRGFLICMFTECDWPDATNALSVDEYYKGVLVTAPDGSKCVAVELNVETLTYTLVPIKNTLKVTFDETIDIPKGTLPNVAKALASTPGRLVCNYFLLSDPFGDLFPYVDDDLKPGKLEQDIVKYTLDGKITKAQNTKYTDNLYFIGHFTELCVPAFSEKSLTTDPEVYKRRDELLKKYAGQLDDPVVMAKIENELIAMDKAYIEGDSSQGYYATSGKAFNICRKRSLCTGGIFDSFTAKDASYSFVTHSLDEGWQEGDLPVLYNDIRKGIYSRGIETADGGVATKELSRIFQDSRIVEPDCGTKLGLSVTLTEELVGIFEYRYLITGNTITVLDPDTIKAYIGKTIVARSPQYCQTKKGYCAKCMGRLFEILGVGNLDMSTVDIGSAFLKASLKKMHGVDRSILDLSDIDRFII